MTRKKRRSTSVREDLHEFTPKQIVNEAKGKKLLNRIEAYEKKYGQADIENINVLAYLTQREAHKKRWQGGNFFDKVHIENRNAFDKKFSKPELGKIRWRQLPLEFRAKPREWPHYSGSYMYNNADQFWNGSGIIDLDELAENGVNGYDHANTDFFGMFIQRMRPDLIFIVGQRGEQWWTTRKEWDEKKELSPDWKITRKYR